MYLCTAPPAWTRARGVADGDAVWPREEWAPAGVFRYVDVAFVGGTEWQRAQVISLVDGWMGWNRTCGVQFRFNQSITAPVRVAFDPGSSWSYIGVRCMNAAPEAPTMNFGWVEPHVSAPQIQRVVLHEFGHALGLMHEHQHPGVAIPWNRPVLYEHYRRTNGWSPQDVETQVIAPVLAETAVLGAYDAESIMGYVIPPELVTEPGWSRGFTYVISAGDKALAQRLYGPAPALG